MVGGADRVVVTKARVELLLVACVTKTQRQVDGVGDVHDIVREQRPVGSVLEITIDGRPAIVKRVEAIKPGHDSRTCSAERARNSRTQSRVDTALRSWAIGKRQTAARNDTAVCKATILVAKAQIVLNSQFLIGIEAADQPVELAVKSLTPQAQFLCESVELTIGIVARRAIENVDFTIIGV